MNLVAIGYDRYNVICNGLAGSRLKYKHALLYILIIWAYSVGACIPPYFGWGAYKLGKVSVSDTFTVCNEGFYCITEGLFITCTYEYVTDDWNPRSFMLFAFVFSYILPLILVGYFYTSIVQAVFFNEAALKRAEIKMLQESAEVHRRKSHCPPPPENLNTSTEDVSQIQFVFMFVFFQFYSKM